MANKERLENPDEDYFVVKTEEVVLKLDEADTFRAVTFEIITGLFLCLGMLSLLHRQIGMETGSMQ